VMATGGSGPLKQFKSWWQFRARYAVLKQMNMGSIKFQQVVAYQNIDELNKKFAPYVLRRTKDQCLDLPEKTFAVREVSLTPETWRVYQELKKEAMLTLGDEDSVPEPNAAVRLLRLCQLTSGHVGMQPGDEERVRDVSSEKLDYFVDEILNGELSSEEAIVCWTRWRRERERLQEMLAGKIEVCRIFGGQQDRNRSFEVQTFQTSTKRRVMIAQVHAGGFGLTLTAASTAVYFSNSFSYTDRVQSSDRIHRIGQKRPCIYVDLLGCGPQGQKSCDHLVLQALTEKKNISDLTCGAWKAVLQ